MSDTLISMLFALIASAIVLVLITGVFFVYYGVYRGLKYLFTGK